MKQKRFDKKLVIKKVTVTNLTKVQQLSIRGGAAGTVEGRTCDGTVQGRTCD
jgi:hypothetical protein